MKSNGLTKGDRVPYAQISNSILFDKDLSLKAKGLYAFMYAKPDDWNFTASSMAAQLKESRKTILNTLDELKKFGLIEYHKKVDGTGRYTIYSQVNKPKSQNGTMVKNSQSPKSAPCKKCTVQKTDCINNKDSITNKDSYNNPIGTRFKSSKKQRLSLSQEVSDFRQKLIKSGYTGHLAKISIELEMEDVYLDVNGLLYTNTKSSKQLVLSTINEIWKQLHDLNEIRKAKKKGMDAMNQINIKRV